MADKKKQDDSLYGKFAKVVAYPYENNSLFRGASDKMDYEARQLLNPNDPNMLSKVVGRGAMLPIGYAAYRGSRDYLSPTERGVAAGSAALLSHYLPDEESEKIYAKSEPEPEEEGYMYKLGKQLVPISMAYGVGKAFANDDVTSGLPYFLAPVLAGMANPKFNPLTYGEEALDNEE